MVRSGREHREQAALVEWARRAERRLPELRLLHAIPNGGDRHPAVAARLQAEGVRAGVPDLCLPVARGGWHGLYIELKAGRGRTSRAQRAWLAALQGEGYRAEVCRGWIPARNLILAYLTAAPPGG